MAYDYYKASKEDVLDWIEENKDDLKDMSFEELEEYLNDTLFIEDSVTGNGSGSYTGDRWEAKEYVIDNMDLCMEALTEFCTPDKMIVEKFRDNEWEFFDITIRCYVLNRGIGDAIEELKEKGLEER